VRVTALAIGAFTAAVALGLLAIGPVVMDAVFGGAFEYGRVGLALMGVGMGLHLFAGTLNQAALARDRAAAAAAAWLVTAAAFVAWLFLGPVADQVLRVEVGYCGAAGLLSGMLLVAAAARSE
jgi:O-antigen/teichoic acid export membrane protein